MFCENKEHLDALAAAVRQAFPAAQVVGATTGGQIAGVELVEADAVVTAIAMERGRVKVARASTVDGSASVGGARVGEALAAADLRMVLVLSEGTRMNGTALVRGLASTLPSAVVIGGGLAADGQRFGSTLVLDGERWSEDCVVGVGFYGASLRVSQGNLGGWHPFGPERLVTRAEGNTVYTFDNKPALDLYMRYIGSAARTMPAPALRFPLSVRTADESGLVRSALAVDEGQRSMTYAGEVPQGSYARLMHSNGDRLVDGAMGAAQQAQLRHDDNTGPVLAMLFSCVGRRMVLRGRTQEELEVVAEQLSDKTLLAGFYGNGEIGLSRATGHCRLLNQTMSILMLAEA